MIRPLICRICHLPKADHDHWWAGDHDWEPKENT